jgi:hypothetical protein
MVVAVVITDMRFLIVIGIALAGVLMGASFVPARSIAKTDPSASLKLV